MSTAGEPVVDEGAAISELAPAETTEPTEEIVVEITDIKASGLPAKVGFFTGLFYVRVKGGKVPQRTKTARYRHVGDDEFVARWDDTVKLCVLKSGLESSNVEIEVYARRFFFNYKVIKKTESTESLADLLEHSETPVELELLEEGQAAGKLTFKISKSRDGHGQAANDQAPPVSVPTDQAPAAWESIPGSPEQGLREELHDH